MTPNPRTRAAWRARASAAVLVGAVVLGGAAAADSLNPGQQQSLMNLLRQDCGSCHGLTMKGGLGAPLLPETLAGKPDEALAEIILDGLPGTPMPAWRPLLTEAEAAWMVKRLKQGLE